jgi:DNA-binding NtrC family response regulator
MPSHEQAILLVDDHTLVRQATSKILHRLGYRVYETDSGDKALQLFDQHRQEIAMLISDIVMPTMDGVTLSNRILELEPNLPVILVTGHDRDAHLARMNQKEKIKLIGKPYDLDAFVTLIGQMLHENVT